MIGWVVALAGARIGLGVGAMSAFLAAAIGLAFVMKLGSLHERKEARADVAEDTGPGSSDLDGVTEGAEVAEVAV